MRTSGAHVRKTCARPRKCAGRAPSAPLISNTVMLYYVVILGFFFFNINASSSFDFRSAIYRFQLLEILRLDNAISKILISNNVIIIRL